MIYGRFGGRTPYNLARQRPDGSVEFTQMGTFLGPADPEKMVAAVLADRRLADWVTVKNGDKEPVLMALDGTTYQLRKR